MNKIINDDCINIGEYLNSPCIDVIITSPPYNNNLGAQKNRKAYDNYFDNKPYKEYITYIFDRFKTILPYVNSGGRLCLNIGSGKNAKLPLHIDLASLFMRKLKLLPMAHIIWQKSHSSRRTSWGSWMSPSCPSFPATFEHILIFAKDTYKHKGNKEDITITREEFIKFANSTWEFPGTKDPEHPAPFPRELPYRLIQMLSYKGNVICDPFMGVGTTCLVAKELERGYIGFDISEKYCSVAMERLSEE